MNADVVARSPSAALRAKLSHPIVDADAHVLEGEFVLRDFIKQVGGPRLLERFEESRKTKRTAPHRRMFWAAPSGKYTLDRATAMLPRLYRERLGEAGVDFAVIYTTYGLDVMQMQDDELRPVVCRALNTMYAEMFKDVGDRMTPSALIPMHTPAEAIAELEYAVKDLGLKSVTIASEVRRPVPEVLREAPHLARYTQRVYSLTIDSPHDYDPFWAKCVELKVAPTAHSGSQTTARRQSHSNFVYNRLGSFGVGGEHLCRSMFLGGVPRRYPTLNVGFLEGGVAWACALYNDLFEFWEKRNINWLREHMDPAKLDMDLMVQMFERYGDQRLTPDYIRAHPDLYNAKLDEDRSRLDDFAACGIETEQDIRDLFVPNFYFGCEADDRMTACAFDTRLNHMGAKLKAVFSSDIGHWDVPDMTRVLTDAWKLVERKLITEDDFEAFTFRNPVTLHARMNPDFFKGTAVESAVDRLLVKQAQPREAGAA
ncbi:MAG: amidohydrolase family protein [Gemmatimonas sp.]